MEYHSLASMYIPCVQRSLKRAPPLLEYHSLALMYPVYRGLQREHPHCWGTTLLSQCILCTGVFKESTPIAGVPFSCLNVSCVQRSSKRAPPLLGYHSLASMYPMHRGLQREHPHYWGTTLLPQCICVQRFSKRAPPLLGYHSLASMYLCTEVFK